MDGMMHDAIDRLRTLAAANKAMIQLLEGDLKDARELLRIVLDGREGGWYAAGESWVKSKMRYEDMERVKAALGDQPTPALTPPSKSGPTQNS